MEFRDSKPGDRVREAMDDAAFEIELDRDNREVTDDEWADGAVLWVRKPTARGWMLVRKEKGLEPFTWADVARIMREHSAAEVIACQECHGTGVDPGSLHEPEPCRECLGGGALIVGELESHEHVERRAVSAQSSALSSARRIA